MQDLDDFAKSDLDKIDRLTDKSELFNSHHESLKY